MHAQAVEPCRMNEKDLKPIIDSFNPFFTDHTWDDVTKTESARLDPYRLVLIRQKACQRHHVLFTLMIEKNEVHDTSKFWVSETFVMLKRVYFSAGDFAPYRKKFEKEFIRYFEMYGVNQSFNFPVEDRTFIVMIESGDWGAKINIEMVRYLLSAKVKTPGIPREKDDGWFKGS